MDTNRLTRVDATTWRIEPHGTMRVPAVIYADENLIRDMDDKVYEQAANVATLPGIVQASYAMPDAHWGYGFPIGGVAAFDPDKGGVVSAGGVGFDISCGVRTMLTGLKVSDVLPVQQSLANSLFRQIPAGVGSRGPITLDEIDMEAMLAGGAAWAVECGWGEDRDLERIEEHGRMSGAQPANVSDRARERQRREVGTGPLGPDMKACPKHCAPLASRCLSAAAWAPAPIFWSAKRRPKPRRLPRHATAPDGRFRGTPRLSSGADARS